MVKNCDPKVIAMPGSTVFIKLKLLACIILLVKSFSHLLMINHALYCICTSETVVVSGLIAVIVVAMITNLGLVATLVWWCHHVTKKQKISSKLTQN